jgi:hypothetical protein
MEELMKKIMGRKMRIKIGIFFFLCGVLWPIDFVIVSVMMYKKENTKKWI